MRSALSGTLDWLGTPRRAPRVVVGLVSTSFSLQVLLVTVVDGPAALLTPPALPGLSMHLCFLLAIVAGASRISGGSLDADRYPRLVAWYLGGFVGFFAINLLFVSFFATDTFTENTGWLTLSGSMGAGVGLVVGVTEARAIDRAVTAERDAAEAEMLAEQRDRFEYMNALLRHEVLNNVQVIRGQAEYLLLEYDDPELADRLEVISRQSEDMAAVIEDVRVVSQGLEDVERRPIDLRTLLRRELTDLRDSHAAVETDLECPAEVNVLGDTLLDRVFSNLVSNAVEHNDADVPRVEVTVECEDDTVTVRVADNGPGVPDAVQESLFDRKRGPHGVGLYLVDTLATHYGGTVELTKSGPEGSVFTVELERAPAAERAVESRGSFDAASSVVSDDAD